MNDHQNFLTIFRKEGWQQLQDAMAAATGTAIITVDYKGIPVTEHSNRTDFCGRVRADAELADHCQKCDSRGGLESARLNRPYVYLCHYNIVDAAIPILAENKYLGAIMVGQVLLPTQVEMEQLEPICIPSASSRMDSMKHRHSALFERIPKLPLESVHRVVNMIFLLSSYIVKESVERNLALELAARVSPGEAGLFGEYTADTLGNVKQSLNRAITNAHIKQAGDPAAVCGNPILRPAFQYMADHKSEMHTVQKMAQLCHVSQSYFSKLFVRETGEKFSTYMQRSRIDWGKQLLETTDKSVQEISDDIGFSDSAHFIKTFKKFEGLTPARYRKFTRT